MLPCSFGVIGLIRYDWFVKVVHRDAYKDVKENLCSLFQNEC